METGADSAKHFVVKNCSLAMIASGERANSLLELRDQIAVVDEGCIYTHFWGARLSMQFAHPQHHNDFAHWAYHRLHDHTLAEVLNIIDPTEYENLDLLRQELIEKIENRLENYEIIPWIRREDRFHFINSKIFVFDSSTGFSDPKDLLDVVRRLSPSSIFYHFIDSRTRTAEKRDDFSEWLRSFGQRYEVLIEHIQAIDPFFLSLTQLRDELINVIERYRKES